jgi:hypothetical protein
MSLPNPEATMSTLTSTFTPLLTLASALGLALAPTCTNTVNFDGLDAGVVVGKQYAGVEFTRGTGCPALPRVVTEPGARSGSNVASIRGGSDGLIINSVCGRLRHPASWLQVYVRNAPGLSGSPVTLVARDAAGAELGASTQTVWGGTGFSLLEVKLPDDRITSFMLIAGPAADLAIDDVTIHDHSVAYNGR